MQPSALPGARRRAQTARSELPPQAEEGHRDSLAMICDLLQRGRGGLWPLVLTEDLVQACADRALRAAVAGRGGAQDQPGHGLDGDDLLS